MITKKKVTLADIRALENEHDGKAGRTKGNDVWGNLPEGTKGDIPGNPHGTKGDWPNIPSGPKGDGPDGK